MYYLLLILSFIFSKLPVQILNILSWLLALLAFDILRVRRRLILDNLKTAGLQNQVVIGRASYHHLALTTFEFLRSYWRPLYLDTQIHGLNHVLEHSKQDRCVYILLAHIGNWEVMAGALAQRYPKVYAVVKKVGSEGVNRFVRELRRRNGWNAIEREAGVGAVSRKLLSAMKESAVIGFVLDQRRGSDPRILFFDKPAHTNHTLAQLCMKYKFPIIPAYAVRDKDYNHHLYFLPELKLGEYYENKDVSSMTREFNKTLEEMILLNPKQYLWQHDRWK